MLLVTCSLKSLCWKKVTELKFQLQNFKNPEYPEVPWSLKTCSERVLP